MAFHPFQTFRRHRKTFLAGLTIMCMFIFILQFGKGDVLDRMMGWFGASRTRKTDVATVYGEKVTDFDLDKLKRQRETADTIVEGLTGSARRLVLDQMSADKGLAEFDTNHQIKLRTAVGMVAQLYQMFSDPRQARMAPYYLSIFKSELFKAHEDLQKLVADLRSQNENERARRVQQLMAVLEYWMWLSDRPPGDRFYFGGSARAADLLDFVMWRKIADKLGITLTQADIRAAINSEALGLMPLDDNASAALAQVLRMFPNPPTDLTIDDVYTALGDELRVYMAQSAVLGYPPGVRFYRYVGTDFNHVPATATPDEFWKYYRDNRTTVRVEMLPIKVSDFLDQVGQPPNDEATEQSLKDLFERYKDIEPNPDRDEPAFHEPRRVGCRISSDCGV